MKKLFSIVVSFFIILCFIELPFQTSSAAENNIDIIKKPAVIQVKGKQTNRIIVKMKEGINKSSVSGYKIVKKNIGKEKKKIVLEVPPTEKLDSFLKKIREKDGVESAEPDYLIKRNYVPQDPFYTSQWYHNKIRTPEAWDKTKGSENITVAVIDGGIDLNHPDLTNQIDVAYDAIYDSYNTVPEDDHGTHVAGIIASSMNNGIGVAGVSPNTRIMVINIFDESGYAYTSDLIDAIYFAISKGANIINMSLGSYQYSSFENDAIQDAYNSGLLIVAAAGNESTYEPSYPASYDNVISVSSTDQDDSDSSFSNYGQYIDIAAPGSNIYSTVTKDTYNWMSGTSMATPVVAGVAALVWASEPSLTNEQVANRLISTADDLGPIGKDYYYGYGRINAKKALKLAMLTVNSINNTSTNVTGKTEKSATVSVTIGSKIYTANADTTGNYKVSIPIQNAGTLITIGAKDQRGNASVPKQINVSKVAPNKPIVNSVNNKSAALTGKTEKSATVSASIGKKVYTAKADKYGNYKVAIPIQNANTLISVKAKDSAGRVSAASNKSVSKVAPDIPIVTPVRSDSKAVLGKAEKYTKVTIKIKTNVYSGKADAYGNFKITIPKQTVGTKINVNSTDSQARVSATRTVTVY